MLMMFQMVGKLDGTEKRVLHGSTRRGFVLLTVLVVVAFLALAAYRYNDLMTSENMAAHGAQRAAQTRALAESGIHYAMSMLAGKGSIGPMVSEQIEVDPGNSSPLKGTFEIIEVDEESAKINLNALLDNDSGAGSLTEVLGKAQALMPELDDAIVSAIIDWMDEDDEEGDLGAENTYYMALENPYRCKNGPLDNLDELLLVKGVTKELMNGTETSPGLRSLFTVASREVNFDAEGASVIHVNSVDLATLESALDAGFGNKTLTQFVIAYRLYGGKKGADVAGMAQAAGVTGSSAATGAAQSAARGDSSALGAMASGAGIDLAKVQEQIDKDKQPNFFRSLKKVDSLFDLAGKDVTVSYQDGKDKKTVTLPSPLRDASVAAELMPQLFALMSAMPTPDSPEKVEMPARMNVNSAPSVILSLLPSLEEGDVQNITSNQPQSGDPAGANLAWLLTKAQVSATKLSSVEKYLTSRPKLFRVVVAGKLDGFGVSTVMEAMIDLSGPRPRIASLQDQSENFRSSAKSAGSGGR